MEFLILVLVGYGIFWFIFKFPLVAILLAILGIDCGE